jgi:hypothetical protein
LSHIDKNCFVNGIKHGLNDPFDTERSNDCSNPGNNPYYDGFIQGCASVKPINGDEICASRAEENEESNPSQVTLIKIS